jgi:hypothetical protein
MPLALGQRLLVHHLFGGGGIVPLIAIIAIGLLLRLWPAIIRWWGRR